MSLRAGSDSNSNSNHTLSASNRSYPPMKMVNYIAFIKTKNVEALRERCRIHFLEPGKKTKVELVALLDDNHRRLLEFSAQRDADQAVAAAAIRIPRPVTTRGHCRR